MEEYRRLLREFVSFRTVSTDPNFRPEIARCVGWLEGLFRKNGLEVEIWRGKESNPVVFASFSLSRQLASLRGRSWSQSRETILIYGHYDVQPAYTSDETSAGKPAWEKAGWKGDPFVVREKDGRLVARGVVDNKGQILIHIYTVIKLIREGKLAYNVKFVIEGDEETGSGEVEDYVAKKYMDELKADHVVISDGELVGDYPVIEVSLRGGFNCTVQYATGTISVHSGIFGGAIPNAAEELVRLITGLYDKNNHVVIPGFYDDVDPISPKQLRNNEKLVRLAPDFLAGTGVKGLKVEKGWDFYTQTGLRPTVQVTGFKSGYIGAGYANIVPATAEARLNFRLVASQNPEKILEAFKRFVVKVTPKYVDVQVSAHGLHWPVVIDVTADKTQVVKRLLRASHGREVLHRHVGGAIPVVVAFQKSLRANTMLVPLANADCHMHGAEENFRIDLIAKGLDFSRRFFSGS